MFDKMSLGRRTLLKAISLTIPALMTSPLKSFAALVGNNAITIENSKPGTWDWLPQSPADNRQIEGYASATSIDHGQSIRIFVNTAEPSYTLEVFRLGWYGGRGGRRVFGPISLQGIQQVMPVPDPVTGLIECNWRNPYVLRTGTGWTTGYYLVKLTAHVTGKQGLVPFVLRDDDSRSPLMFQVGVTTYQAYNAWGGKSLYEYNSTGGIAAVKVSFNRPYDRSDGAGQLYLYDQCMLRFLEREGYDVAYTCNITTHTNASMLRRRKAFLSAGHDEYWSLEMRRNITAARDRGVHLGFFGANCCYWQIRLEPSATGAANRTIVCYRDRFKDPLFGIDNSRVTELWRSDIVNQPEEQLVGVQYDFFPVDADLVVYDASHWIFEGTGLTNGMHLPGLLGYEADRRFGGGPSNLILLCSSPVSSAPTITSATIANALTSSGQLTSASVLSEKPDLEDEQEKEKEKRIAKEKRITQNLGTNTTRGMNKRTAEELGIHTLEQQHSLVQAPLTLSASGLNSEMTIYTAPSGALVFATGSMQFNWGLDDGVDGARVPLVNPAAQRMVRNLFARFA